MNNSFKVLCRGALGRLPQKAAPAAAVVLLFAAAGVCWQKSQSRSEMAGSESAQRNADNRAIPMTKTAAAVPQSDPSSGVREPESFWQAFAEAQHQVQSLTEREAALPQNRGVRYFAANPGQQLTARFMDAGVRIESGSGGGWQGTLAMTSVSREGEEAALPGETAPVAKGARVEYKRGDVVEWFENRSEGLEHGFTVMRNPVAGEGELRVDMKFAGLKAAPQTNSRGARFHNRDGAPVLAYEELKVWDARGKGLDSRIEAVQDRLSIIVADAGAVYPLMIDPIISSLEQKLGPEVTGSGAPEDHFGTSVALDGQTAVVGTPGDDTAAGEDAGSAFVFVRTGAIWTLQARLTASDAAMGKGFGGAVAVSSNTIVVGSVPVTGHPVGQAPQMPMGSAYAFVRSGNAWTQQAILAPAEPSFSFGTSVAVGGDTALVGDSLIDRAHVFVRNATVWSIQTVLTPSDQLSGSAFGASVSISGETAFVGAPYASDGLSTASVGPMFLNGAAYAFVRTGTNWSEQQKLPGGHSLDFFGGAVSVLGDRVLVGATGVDTPAGLDAGAAYIYGRSGTSWGLQGLLTPTDGIPNGSFGAAVSLGTDRALVGSPHTNAAYVFEPSITLPTGEEGGARVAS
ncbi:MAG TPA: hypothetical protein VD994_07870, partial [Prosthecobacter sp.]|nr:hypothetical protein [Prosthecobacter sp.]